MVHESSSNADDDSRLMPRQEFLERLRGWSVTSHESPDTAFYPVIHDDFIDDKQFLQPRHDDSSRVCAFNEDGCIAMFIIKESSRLSQQAPTTGFVPIPEDEEETFALRLRPRPARFLRPINPVAKKVHGEVMLSEQDEATILPNKSSCCPIMTPRPSAPEWLLTTTTPPALKKQRERILADDPALLKEPSFLPISPKVLLPMF
jgi:hypothetical protein